jgi:cytochrome c-type biogenesis protein CcmH/NrfG
MIRRDSLALVVSLLCSVAIMAWIVWSQTRSAVLPAAAGATVSPTPAPPAAPALDETRVEALRQTAESDPTDVESRIGLGDLYFDAHQFDQAIGWYEQALALDPTNVNVSTDLGVAYYYTQQVDRALAQFDRSLDVSPSHPQTMLNIGIVRAFGKQDLEGARQIWQQVIDQAPDSPEAAVAREALQRIQTVPPGQGPPAEPAGTS